MIDRLITLLVALSLAFLVWLYARSRDQDTLDNVPIPVQITLAAGQADLYELDIPDPCQIPASFVGPPSRIRELRNMLHKGEIRVEITLTVPENLPGESPHLDTVRVDATDIHVPVGVQPMVVEGRNRIPVTLHRIVERQIPVRFNHLLDDRIAQVVVEPATVMVRGPQEILERTRSIATLPYSLSSKNEDDGDRNDTTVQATVPLVREIEGRTIRSKPSAVRVRFKVRALQKVYELTEVPVKFLCPANFAYRPRFGDERAGKISLKVQGPTGEEPREIVAYIDLTGNKFKDGLYADEPLKLQLPKDFELTQPPPRSGSFQLVPIDAALTGDPKLRVP
ncbi:MAG: CdaR family protein [Gemmataceae bacterium]